MYSNYTQEEREAALSVSLTDLAKALGYTPQRKGAYYSLQEMDSVMISNDRSWCRWSKIHAGESSGRGGTQIDFMMEFGGCSSVPEAVHEILALNHVHILREVEQEPLVRKQKEMVLPEQAEGCRYMYAYLCKTRKLSPEVVSYFHRDLKILYESKEHHNLVFLGKDKEGTVRYAMQRGTSDIYGRTFKGDVLGNDKSHGVNIVNKASPVLKVFEASIDCMSYIDITGDTISNKLVLGMLDDKPLRTFLEEYSHIKEVVFCLDNDVPARNAILGNTKEEVRNGEKKTVRVPGLLEVYREKGYCVSDEPANPQYGKDYNENLKQYRESAPEKIHGMARRKVQSRHR